MDSGAVYAPLEQQRKEANRAEVYALNVILTRQAEARWHEVQRLLRVPPRV